MFVLYVKTEGAKDVKGCYCNAAMAGAIRYFVHNVVLNDYIVTAKREYYLQFSLTAAVMCIYSEGAHRT